MTPSLAPSSSDVSTSDEALWQAAVGKHSDYYLPRFAKYEKGEGGFPSWHWPAFFALGLWALYRKAWGSAVLLFSLQILVVALLLIAARLFAPGNETASENAFSIGGLLCAGLAAMLANSLYYRRVKALVRKARARYPDTAAQLAFLSAKGGTSYTVVAIAIGLSVLVT